ncbi:MAG: molybdopterin-dependent oxidoreductase [Acidimicrobiia bacterium]
MAERGGHEPTIPAPDPLERHLATRAAADHGIAVDNWAGGIPEKMAEVPQVRVGRRWVSMLWLIPLGLIGLIVAIAIAQHLRTYSWMQDFIRDYPGTGSFAPNVEGGFPWWLRWQHFFNILFMLFIIRAGLQILADHPRLTLDSGSTPGREWLRLRGPVPADRMDPSQPERVWTAKDDAVALPRQVGLPGFRHSIGLARWWHFTFDLLFVINGAIFFVLLFTTSQWQRVVPQSWDVFPNALSTAVQYASLDFPPNEGFTHFNGLQVLTYFVTIFVAAPIAIVTGLLQGPSIAARFGTARGVFNRQVARTVHFLVLAWMVFFILVHTLMIWITGLLGNLNHITLGTNTGSWWALAIYGAGMAVVVVLWAAASPFTIRHPDTVRRIGQRMVGWIKGLMEWSDPRAEYEEKDISPFFWPNGEVPVSDEFKALAAGGFADYRLRVDGLCENPTTFSHEQLKAMPKREQITQHYCIQGWSAIAKWGGVPMSDIMDVVRPTADAEYAVFYSFGGGAETGDDIVYYYAHRIENMRHRLTILAYEMNGEPLDITHGAPLRLRDENELGFKQVKWIQAVEFVESFAHLGAGQGGYNEDQEFYGYREPI